MGKNILRLLIYSYPIYASVLINIFTGLTFYISLFGSIALVYILSDKKNFIRNLIGSFNYQSIMTVVAIFIIKDIILKMDGLLSIFNGLFLSSDSIYTTMVIFLISYYFFGFITGNNSASLAILLLATTFMSGLYCRAYGYYNQGFI